MRVAFFVTSGSERVKLAEARERGVPLEVAGNWPAFFLWALSAGRPAADPPPRPRRARRARREGAAPSRVPGRK